VTVYHWPRIFAAIALAAIVLFVALGFAFWGSDEDVTTYTSDSSETAPASAQINASEPSQNGATPSLQEGASEVPPSPAENAAKTMTIETLDTQQSAAPQSSNPPSSEPASRDEMSSVDDGQTAIEAPIDNATPSQETAETDKPVDATDSATVDAAPSAEPAPMPTDEQTQTPPPSQPVAATTATSPASQDQSETEAAGNTASSSDPVTILSSHVSRAQLTSELQNKDPVDQLGSTIAMNEEGLIKVFLFAELEDLKGDLVYYDWYHDGERVARISVRPYLESMRASSSKFITARMIGSWRAEILRSSGEKLATAEFEVR